MGEALTRPGALGPREDAQLQCGPRAGGRFLRTQQQPASRAGADPCSAWARPQVPQGPPTKLEGLQLPQATPWPPRATVQRRGGGSCRETWGAQVLAAFLRGSQEGEGTRGHALPQVDVGHHSEANRARSESPRPGTHLRGPARSRLPGGRRSRRADGGKGRQRLQPCLLRAPADAP